MTGATFTVPLEATAYAVRHNMEAMAEAGVRPKRVVAVGGGASASLWPQIVTDITGLPQVLHMYTVGAAYGDAWMAARLMDPDAEIDQWNPPASILTPRADIDYRQIYQWYRDLHESTREIQHSLAQLGSDPAAGRGF
jgi:xylulokinase